MLSDTLVAALQIGYLAGLSTSCLRAGLWVRHPGHLAVGTVLLVVCSLFLVSRKIRGAQSPWRTPHFALGLTLLCVFLVQVLLGLNIFL